MKQVETEELGCLGRGGGSGRLDRTSDNKDYELGRISGDERNRGPAPFKTSVAGVWRGVLSIPSNSKRTPTMTDSVAHCQMNTSSPRQPSA